MKAEVMKGGGEGEEGVWWELVESTWVASQSMRLG
jgi:hypothetical protein